MATNVVRSDWSRIYTGKATATAAGIMFLCGTASDRVCLALGAIGAGEKGACLVKGEVKYDKDNTGAWTAGQIIYWDDTAKKLTHTSTANTRAGIASEDAASAATEGKILLNF